MFTKLRASAFGLAGTAAAGAAVACWAQQAHAAPKSAPADYLTAPFGNSNPGVYVWGDNSHQLIELGTKPAVRVPTRVALLDNHRLRDLAVCPAFGVAALANGDVVQFTAATTSLGAATVLRGRNVAQLRVSPQSQVALALTRSGAVYAWREGAVPQPFSLDAAKLGWFEKIVDVACGVDHVVARTNRGRVLTGSLPTDTPQHHGQFGIAQFSHFEGAPPPFQLFPIKLLPEKTTQIACGRYHSLFLTEGRELWASGSNGFGQLLLPFTFKNMKNSVPVRIGAGVHAIAAGGDLTYFRKGAYSSRIGSDGKTDVSTVGAVGSGDSKWFVAGDGEFGQFGTGSFAQCQVDPLELRALANLREYDEARGRVVATGVATLGVGATHVFAQLDNLAGDWLMWGSNERGQLGNSKLSKVVKPIPVNSTENFAGSEGYQFVVGDRISGCFMRA